MEIIREDHGGFRQGIGRYVLDVVLSEGQNKIFWDDGWVSLHVLVMMMGESSSRVGLYYLV